MVYIQYMPRPAKVLLLGESARDETVRSVLTEVLKSVMEDMPEILQEGTEDIGARGAAELARRSPWNPYRGLQEKVGRLNLVDDTDKELSNCDSMDQDIKPEEQPCNIYIESVSRIRRKIS